MAYIGSGVATDSLLSLQSESILRYCQAGVSALVLYEHVTTVPEEINTMWGRRWSSVTVIFYLMRWANSALALFYAITYASAWDRIARSATITSFTAQYDIPLVCPHLKLQDCKLYRT
ncbi:hypothetical protein OBBRIDRAFT_351068 [Obba rivulosa]|uniref:DUF6533 domain-containing protein n=1 Tax=Obba rivulosa TaxID=1052685 RepID=A0A8E2J2A4_9APHY|nr:hypothetical protein OBBRIDRAFT_351068 [Obba rivulosa]